MEQSVIWNTRLKAVAFGLAIALSALTIRHWYETFSLGHPSCETCRPDFQAVYSGAKLMWENRAKLYDLNQQLTIQKSIDHRVDDSALAFAYPPTTALLLMPLGWLSFSSAYLAMGIINILMLIMTLRLLKRDLKLNREQYRWLWLTTCCSFGVQSTILQGQTSLLLVMTLSLFMCSLSRGNQATAGLWNGALFLKPQLLPVPLLVLGAQRRWQAVALATLLIAGLFVGSVLLVGWEGVNDYFRLAQRFGAPQSDIGTNPQAMHNLRALVYYALPPSLVTVAWITSGILIGIGVLLLNAKIFDAGKRTALQWVGNLSAIILMSPHLHAHDLALLIPANALVLSLCRDAVPVVASGSLLAVGIFPLLPWVLERTLPPVIPLFFLIALIRCIWLIRCRTARG